MSEGSNLKEILTGQQIGVSVEQVAAATEHANKPAGDKVPTKELDAEAKPKRTRGPNKAKQVATGDLDIEADEPDSGVLRAFEIAFKDCATRIVHAKNRGEAWQFYKRYCGILSTTNEPTISGGEPLPAGCTPGVKE